MSGRNCSVLMQARIRSKRIALVFLCQEDNWGIYCTQAFSLRETKGTCAIIAMAFMRRGVMLNSYSLEVLVTALPFSATSACQATDRLHSDVAIMFMGVSSEFLLSQEDKSIVCFSCNQNQLDTNNLWDPGILKFTHTYTLILLLTTAHFIYMRTTFHGIVDMYLLVGTCKMTTTDCRLTCQEVTLGVDCSNVQILEYCLYGEVLILEVKFPCLSFTIGWFAVSSIGHFILFHCIHHLAKAIPSKVIISIKHRFEMPKSFSTDILLDSESS